jgi:anti-sigma B factor antagonist
MEPQEFAVETLQVGDRRAVVRVAGDVDLFTAAELRASLRAALDAGAGEIVVDLGAVTFLDSSGLAALVAGHRAAQLRRRPMTIVVDDPAIRRPFAVAGLDELLPVVTTAQAALGRPNAR